MGGGIALIAVAVITSCGPEYIEAFDPDEQLAIDIEIIENYLSEKGYTEYDTIENDIRVVVLDEGAGAPIELNDIVTFHFIGRFLDNEIFDTSSEEIALEQDLLNTIDTTFQTEKDDITPILDDEGNKIIRSINFVEGYFPIYVSSRNYEPYITTHTPGGWFADQTFGSLIAGFSPSAHYMLSNINLDGSVIAIMPSSAAYGDTRDPSLMEFRNTVLIFEFRPIFKR